MEQKTTTLRTHEIQFSHNQHQIWADLFSRQISKIRQYACKEYLEGFDILGLSSTQIPTINNLNSVIRPRTGWRTVRTTVRYSDAVPWYQHFNRKQFLITNYMREREEMDFTPEPDMFHDIFGHLPFMVLSEYTELQELFAPAFLRANTRQRENIKKLAWFSTEFGLIQQKGALKIFGAGLISSYDEISNALSGKVPILPFSVDNVLNYQKAIYNFNETLFVFNSISELSLELRKYFDTV